MYTELPSQRNYTDTAKAYRKLMLHDFNSPAARQFWDVQEAEAYILACDLLNDGKASLQHFKKCDLSYRVKRTDHFVP